MTKQTLHIFGDCAYLLWQGFRWCIVWVVEKFLRLWTAFIKWIYENII